MEASSGDSLGQGRKSFGEHNRSADDVFRGSVLIRSVAVSVAAGDKEHGHRSDSRDEERVMIGAAYHGKEIQFVLPAGLGKRFDDCGSAVGRGVGVQQLQVAVE